MEMDVEMKTPKIKNGARISIGVGVSSIHFIVDHHFNWFPETDDKMVLWF